MGMSPLKSGWPLSCIGITARSEMSSVTTNSLVCSWLICRLPITRTAKIIVKYKMIVRTNEINMAFSFPYVFGAIMRLRAYKIRPFCKIYMGEPCGKETANGKLI